MTVTDLIEQLKRLPQNRMVYMFIDYGQPLEEVECAINMCWDGEDLFYEEDVDDADNYAKIVTLL